MTGADGKDAMTDTDTEPTANEQRVRLDQGFTPDTIREWLQTQRGVAQGYVRLDTGDIVPDGYDADGEADAEPDQFDRNLLGGD